LGIPSVDMGAFSDLRGQFDPVNRKKKGDQFEIVCKWFLENDSTRYKALLRRVWLWKDWPGNWGVDAGIDLVAEDTEGRLWAIQAKAYENSITKSEVDKFLTESSRPIFSYRVLMATTDELSPIAQRTMEDLGVSFIGLTELEEFPDWPTHLTDLRPAKPRKPKRPFAYQRAAINDVVNGFKSADRGQLIMACGTGKTLTAWFIKEKLAAERTLVLVPSLSLLKQTMKEWRTANIERPFDALPVCSDETVGHDEDAAISHTSYLGEPADTDPKVIAAFLRKRSGPRVVFSTYHSSPQIAAAFALGRVPGFDLVIADEAHRVAGPASSDFATVLNPAAIKTRRRLFMTATPRFFTGRVIREAMEAEDEIASMDDDTKFGGVFHRLGFSEAIERKLLTDYQVAIIGVDDATYRDWADRGQLVRMNSKKTDARSLAGQIGLAKAMRKYGLHRVISFHGRVSRAHDFAESMPKVIDWMPARQRPKGPLWSKHASGKMTAGRRHNLLQHLTRLDDGERGLLANARCLAEGVDVPTLDGVAFIDPRRSEIDIVQAVGRAIRKSDTKTVGTIVIPVFIDTGQDPEVVLDDSVFKPVWDVIKALRAHDEELGRQLDELRRDLGRQRGRLRLPTKIRHDLAPSVSADFARAFDVRIVEQTTATWEFWFGVLQKYVIRTGDSLVPVHAMFDGHNLGGWVTSQRSLYGKGKLAPERQSQLEGLAGWTWQPHDDKWERGLNQLLAYVGRKGHAQVSALYTYKGFKLGGWVTRQRWARTKGRLDANRQSRLESIPGWTWEPINDFWEEGFEQLVDFVERNGHALVPQGHVHNDFRLGGWLRTQRGSRTRARLDRERERRLEAVPGWSWDPFTDKWEEGFRRLAAHVKEEGHARIPSDSVIDGYKVGSWVEVQRRKHAKGQLDARRAKRLEQLPGWMWSPHGEIWEDGFAKLVKYAETEGNSRPPAALVVDGFLLGQWVSIQRGKYVSGQLTENRLRRLDRLDVGCSHVSMGRQLQPSGPIHTERRPRPRAIRICRRRRKIGQLGQPSTRPSR
jgi:superfamily II DNA or RNA helicase